MALAIVATLLYIDYATQKIVKHEIENAKESAQKMIKESIEKKYDIGITNTVAIASNPEIKNAIKNENREELIKLQMPL